MTPSEKRQPLHQLGLTKNSFRLNSIWTPHARCKLPRQAVFIRSSKATAPQCATQQQWDWSETKSFRLRGNLLCKSYAVPGYDRSASSSIFQSWGGIGCGDFIIVVQDRWGLSVITGQTVTVLLGVSPVGLGDEHTEGEPSQACRASELGWTTLKGAKACNQGRAEG